ncbi:MAG: CvpA family protein [Rhodospirillales bacterium]|nr:MAG: CvpA family protein [Rhodospirillales bacterium]
MGELSFTLADGIVVLILLVSALLAFARGFVHEVLAIAGWVGAIFATIYGLPLVRPYARSFIDNTTVADIGAGVVIFLVSLILLSLLTRAIAGQVRNSQLNALDRSLGFLFGLARGAVLVAIIYIAVDWLVPRQDQPDWIRNARTLSLVEAGADMLRSLVPSEPANRGARAANEAAEEARKALETHRILRDMMSPEPRADGDRDTGSTGGYDRRERQELERLLDGSQQR